MSETVTVVLRSKGDGVVVLSLPTGESLMHGLRSRGVGITSVCHGRAICGMCRVLVDSAATSLAAPGRDERRLLDVLPDTTPDHRLACQILLGPEYEGTAFVLDEPAAARTRFASSPRLKEIPT
jgi:ferredoxin